MSIDLSRNYDLLTVELSEYGTLDFAGLGSFDIMYNTKQSQCECNVNAQPRCSRAPHEQTSERFGHRALRVAGIVGCYRVLRLK